MTNKIYDVIVIGGGPGGYLAAERLAHKKRKVLLIEKQYLGGTCLNVGCIPTKTLLNSAKHYIHAKEAGEFGVHATNVQFNFSEMMAWKQKTVDTLCGGVAGLMKKLKVEVIQGTAQFLGNRNVSVLETGETYEGRAIIIAAGSVPAMPPISGAKNNPRVIDSTALLSIDSVPKTLCIIGGGVIGIEFASLFSSLGAKVFVVEMMDEIIPPMDKDHAPVLRKALETVDFYLGCRVERIEDNRVVFTAKDKNNNIKESSVEADTILMAVGRRAETASWFTDHSGLDMSKTGVVVDDTMKTNLPAVWAIGDVNGKSMLAHSAYRMAEVAARNINRFLDLQDGKSPTEDADTMRYNAIPWVVYSMPEVAGCGITEQEAERNNISVLTSQVPMLVSGRFIAENGVKAPGMVKVIADKKTRRILGVHILGAYASEMIWGVTSLIENELRIDDVKEMIFPHPTVCEAIREAIWAMD